MSSLIPALAAGAGLFSNLFNIGQQNKQNNRSQRFTWEMYAQQRRDALADWNMQNAYNDPAAQMQRLQAAGLNPHLVYGNGADAQSGSAPRGSDAPSPQFNAPRMNMDTNSIALMALQAQQLKANINRTEAETMAIKSRTVGQEFENQLKERIGLDQMQYRYNTEVSRLSQQQKRELMDFENELAIGYGGKGADDPNSPISKARRAGYDRALQELENAAVRGDIYAAEAAIKKYEKNLTDIGISPNSPFWAKAITTLIGRILGNFGIDTN